MKHHVGITVDSELFREIEQLRGREKRSTFWEYLLRLGLKAYKLQQTAKEKPSEPEPLIFDSKGRPF